MITYEELVDVNGTIYSKEGKGYKTPTELAADLGIQPHQIDWTKIKPSATVPGVAAPSVSPVPPIPEPPPTKQESAAGTQRVNPDTGQIEKYVPYQGDVPPGAVKPEGTWESISAGEGKPRAGERRQIGTTEYTYGSKGWGVGEELPYIRHPNGIDIYDRQGNYISAAKAAQIPNFWDLVEISESAPDTSKGAGLGGPVEGATNLPYITYNGIDVYNKLTGEYIDFETANRLDIWNKIETAIDTEKIESLGIDITSASDENPFQTIYNDFKDELEKINDKLDTAWLEYDMKVIDIEENPFLFTGEIAQRLKKLKKQRMVEINALTATKKNLLESFNLAVGITEKIAEFEKEEEVEAPDVYTTTDNEGNVTGIDKVTGEVLWVRPGIGKATEKGTGGFTAYQQWQMDKYYEDEKKRIITDFYNDINDAEDVMDGYSPKGHKTREELIDELSSKYPQLTPESIRNEIYKHYPDLTLEEREVIAEE